MALDGLDQAYQDLGYICDGGSLGLAGDMKDNPNLTPEENDFARWHEELSRSAKRFTAATSDYIKREGGGGAVGQFVADKQLTQFCDYAVKHWDHDIDGALDTIKAKEAELMIKGRYNDLDSNATAMGLKTVTPVKGLRGALFGDELEAAVHHDRTEQLMGLGNPLTKEEDSAFERELDSWDNPKELLGTLSALGMVTDDGVNILVDLGKIDPYEDVYVFSRNLLGLAGASSYDQETQRLAALAREINTHGGLTNYLKTLPDVYGEFKGYGVGALGSWGSFWRKVGRGFKSFGNKCKQAFRRAGNWVKRTARRAGRWVKHTARKIGAKVKQAARWVGNKAKGIFQNIGKALRKTVTWIKNGVTYIWDKTKGFFIKVGNALKRVANKVWEALKKFGKRIGEILKKWGARINPKNIIVRCTMLRKVRKNEGEMATGCYWGTMSFEKAKQTGCPNRATWSQCKKAYEGRWKEKGQDKKGLLLVFQDYAGYETKLKEAIRVGVRKSAGKVKMPYVAPKPVTETEMERSWNNEKRQMKETELQAAEAKRIAAIEEKGAHGLGELVTLIISLIIAIINLIIAIIKLVQSVKLQKFQQQQHNQQRKEDLEDRKHRESLEDKANEELKKRRKEKKEELTQAIQLQDPELYYEKRPNGKGGYDIVDKKTGKAIYTNLSEQKASEVMKSTQQRQQEAQRQVLARRMAVAKAATEVKKKAQATMLWMAGGVVAASLVAAVIISKRRAQQRQLQTI